MKIKLLTLILCILPCVIYADVRSDFFKAVTTGDSKTVKQLADKVDINEELEAEGIIFTLLVFSVLLKLLDAGANINLKEGRGNTPLKLAKLAGNEEMVTFLKSKGAK